MRRATFSIALAFVALTVALPAGAFAAGFGLEEFGVAFENEDGTPATQAGSHPYAMRTSLHFNVIHHGEKGQELVGGVPKDILVSQAPGLAGNPTATPRCPGVDFVTIARNVKGENVPACPDSTAVGVVAATLADPTNSETFYGAVYNLTPPPGKAAKLGFWIEGVPLPIELTISESFPYTITGGPTNIAQAVEVVGSTLTLWGVPADPTHNSLRGHCIAPASGKSLGSCSPGGTERPFLTLPRACTGTLITDYKADPWGEPGAFVEGFAETPEMTGCGRLGFTPGAAAFPTAASAESASGLDFETTVNDENLENPSYEAVADADIAATELVLPAGITANPSAAEGLGVCTLKQFETESLANRACPEAAKLGDLEATTPLLEDHTLHGSVYLSEPDHNPFNSFLAVYVIVRDEERGVFLKLAGEVKVDPKTGQLITTVKEMPPLPISSVDLRLRSGPRAPLVTPPTCGTYEVKTILTPTSGSTVERTTPFTISSGPNGSSCLAALPFTPGFGAGTANNAAGRYSPFSMRITRGDGEQDITRFSATLPPGAVAKIAGVGQCPEAAIEAAKSHTGKAELASPSCPADSKLGSVLAGAGVGTALTYAGGSLYLAGPYNGDPLSVVAIVPAVAGPFDVGTVVTRVALALDPESGRAEVDGTASDPIPHILRGIPLKVRDLRVNVDRPEFTLNATSCRRWATEARLGGSGTDPFSSADDTLFTTLAPYQAASCASLGFKPTLTLRLKGGTRRNDHPSLHSVITYPKGPDYANVGRASVILPHSEFIDPERINSPCTRVQFAEQACPKSSILGSARAFTPLLDSPLEGNVYFRSNGGLRHLPDIVVDLRGQFHVVLVGAVDSVNPKNARIRTTFENPPDAPVSKFELTLKGGKEGILVNSADLCAHVRRARVALTGQNGAQQVTKPALKVDCKAAKG